MNHSADTQDTIELEIGDSLVSLNTFGTSIISFVNQGDHKEHTNPLERLSTACGTTNNKHNANIKITYGAMKDPEQVQSFTILLDLLQGLYEVQVELHLSNHEQLDHQVIGLITNLRRSVRPAKGVPITIVGPFDVIPIADLDLLFHHGVSLIPSYGWWPGCSASDTTTIKYDSVREIAEFGFISPVRLYVHGDNIKFIPELVDECLSANIQSGFSTPLYVESPLQNGQYESIEKLYSEDYINLLIDLYQKYPYHDKNFSPLNGIVENIASGGWDTINDIPSNINLILKGDQSIHHYLLSAKNSSEFMHCNKLKLHSKLSFIVELVKFVKSRTDWRTNEFCGSCNLKYLCCGYDPITIDPDVVTVEERSLVCDHRMLFLKYFLTQKFERILSF